MQLHFRQGIAKSITGFLQSNGTAVNLVATPQNPVVLNVADKNANYLVTEQAAVTSAWVGPFTPSNNYWLYWDINVKTGLLTRGFTTIAPTAQASPPSSPQHNQCWFDTVNTTMFFWNAAGSRWVRCIRVFAAQYNGSVFNSISINAPLFTGTQVGNNNTVSAGAIVYDIHQRAIKSSDDTLFNLETIALAGVSSGSKLKLGAALLEAEVQSPINAYSVVKFSDFDKIIPATSYDVGEGVYGMVEEDATTGTFVNIIVEGVIQNNDWDWSASSVGAPLYVGSAGELSATAIGTQTIVGYVVNANTVYFKPVVADITAVGGGGTVLPVITSPDDGRPLVANFGTGEYELGRFPPPDVRLLVSDLANATYESNILYAGYAEPAPTLPTLPAFSASYDIMSIGKKSLEFVPLTINGLDQVAGSGQRNVAIGYKAGEQLTTGSGNIFLGSSSHRAGTTSTKNIVIGHQAGETMNGDTGNVLIGYNVNGGNTTGSNNIMISTPHNGLTVEYSELNNSIILGQANTSFSQSDSFVVTSPVSTGSNVPMITGSFSNKSIILFGDVSIDPVIVGLQPQRITVIPAVATNITDVLSPVVSQNLTDSPINTYFLNVGTWQHTEITLNNNATGAWQFNGLNNLVNYENQEITVLVTGHATQSVAITIGSSVGIPVRIPIPPASYMVSNVLTVAPTAILLVTFKLFPRQNYIILVNVLRHVPYYSFNI